MTRTRREYLTTASALGVASLAGCLGMGGGPEYDSDEVTRDDLLLTEAAFPSGWSLRPDVNEYYRVFGDPDDSIFIGLDAEVYEEVGMAREAFEKARSKFAETNDYDLADEAFWAVRNEQYAAMFFRDSNALGVTFGLRQSGFTTVPDQARAINYAEKMYEHWRSL